MSSFRVRKTEQRGRHDAEDARVKEELTLITKGTKRLHHSSCPLFSSWYSTTVQIVGGERRQSVKHCKEKNQEIVG